MLPEVDLADHRVGGQLFGRTRFQDLALVEQVGAVGDGQRLVDVVVGDDHADVLVLERRHDRLDVLHGDRVHAGERFIQQDERRIDGHGARDLRTAAFAARELYAEAFAHLLQPELLDQRFDAFVLVLLREGGHLQHGPYVVLHREAAEYRRLLRQIAYAELGAAVYGQVRQFGGLAFVAFEENAPFVGLDQSHDHVEGRGLAGSVGTQKAYDLSLVDVDRHVVDDGPGLVFLDELAGVKTHCVSIIFLQSYVFFRKVFYLYIEFYDF